MDIDIFVSFLVTSDVKLVLYIYASLVTRLCSVYWRICFLFGEFLREVSVRMIVVLFTDVFVCDVVFIRILLVFHPILAVVVCL